MTAQAERFVCPESRSELHGFADDGARCGNAMHWHPRRGSGFAGARPSPAVTYCDVELAPPKPVATAAQAEGGD